ncbi:transcription termination factor MTERF4, chloroplastic [Benincasa hispida]|uniref:transcription termination factor MTERF4, chloroplastic n=1 Tax=Benincasa hispida TaxID=102211 RepID=UPI0019026259|nr:transcription termination factor MTERF4, chloroplastic [Benincasa hispida]XP_038895304.1 transcription termination factor MTERF4, chloroplastic [Benincasa hispida]XP_038895305.1 transcription termination factor MTERF4, chloroplastic [Benincasa hispida]
MATMASFFFPIPTINGCTKSSPLVPLHRFNLPQPPSFFPLTFCPFPSRFPFLLTSSHFVRFASTSSDALPFSDGPPEEDPLHSLAEARLAVSEYLQRFGVSEDESVSIASNSPRFLKMLVDGVRELDETSMWVSWSKEGGEQPLVDDFGFKEKVGLMAMEKGDHGKVAFLESVGMNLSSAMNVARYLSGEMLPSLIYKVKYMKGLFFSGSGDGEVIGKNARRMMTNLSIPPDDDVQQTLSFFEKIEARRGGLDMLCSNEESFRLLLESFPHMLFLSVESHVKPVVEFLENIGIPKERTRSMFLLFPPIIFFDTEVLKSRILAFEEVGIEATTVGKLLLKYPWITANCIQGNLKQIVSFLELEKVPNASIINAISSWPLILGSSTSKLQLMVDRFGGLGVQSKKLGQVIATSPQILLQKPQEFLQVVSYLEELGFDKGSVGRIITRCPEISATSVEKTLKRKIEFLISIGVSKTHLPRAIRKYPELLVSDPDKTLLPRIRYLRQRGFSERDIAFMVGRFSPVLGYSIEEVLRPKLDFLVNIMEKSIKEVVDYPRYFSYSLEKKIVPRFRVLKGINVECSLKDMLGKNDEEFAVQFMGYKGTEH